MLPDARAELVALPDTPGIELWLINADFFRGRLSQEEMLAVLDKPAYWAFCWASGQVMANYLLAHPACVVGKTVVDFGSGSGVVAIAAALAGAHKVIACDIDPDAILATTCNVAHNQVAVEVRADFAQINDVIDLIIVADVLYDRGNLPLLDTFITRAPEVLVADSRVRDFNFPPYRLIAQCEGTTVPDLNEFDEFRQVNIYYAGHKVSPGGIV